MRVPMLVRIGKVISSKRNGNRRAYYGKLWMPCHHVRALRVWGCWLPRVCSRMLTAWVMRGFASAKRFML